MSALLNAGNRTEAIAAGEEAARLGDARAQYVLAVVFSTEGYAGRDIPRALALMRQAAAQGLLQARARLPQIEQLAAASPPAANPAPRRETRVHNPALEATHCVRIVEYGTRGSRGFTQSIANECGRVVEVSWCSTGGECERDGGNSWTLVASGPGSGYPVGSGEVRYGACLGRNSGGFAQGSQGQRTICAGDAGARPR